MSKKLQKTFLLVFVFILIPLIYLFLQQFGENQFNLKRYYQEEVPVMELPCSKITAPYAVSSSLWIDTDGDEWEFPNQHINLIMLLDAEKWRVQMNHLNSLKTAFAGKADIETLVMVEAADSVAQKAWAKRVKIFQEQIPDWGLYADAGFMIEQYFDCTLLKAYSNPEWEDVVPDLPATQVAVLLDRENNIRGYYNLTLTTEYDRLVMEIGVMLLEYKQANNGSKSAS